MLQWFTQHCAVTVCSWCCAIWHKYDREWGGCRNMHIRATQSFGVTAPYNQPLPTLHISSTRVPKYQSGRVTEHNNGRAILPERLLFDESNHCSQGAGAPASMLGKNRKVQPNHSLQSKQCHSYLVAFLLFCTQVKIFSRNSEYIPVSLSPCTFHEA